MHMRERGGNHCFVGAVPIPRDAGRAAESTLCDAASAAGFEFEVRGCVGSSAHEPDAFSPDLACMHCTAVGFQTGRN
jgi:hypothetical protein